METRLERRRADTTLDSATLVAGDRSFGVLITKNGNSLRAFFDRGSFPIEQFGTLVLSRTDAAGLQSAAASTCQTVPPRERNRRPVTRDLERDPPDVRRDGSVWHGAPLGTRGAVARAPRDAGSNLRGSSSNTSFIL
jgi:hypothetical protein